MIPRGTVAELVRLSCAGPDLCRNFRSVAATRIHTRRCEAESVAVSDWPSVALKLLLAIARRTADGRPVRYEPAAWLQQRPTSKNRSRWSRWTRRLANAGLVHRLTEPNRDRVRQVVLTTAGMDWIHEHCGAGAIDDLDLYWGPAPDSSRHR